MAAPSVQPSAAAAAGAAAAALLQRQLAQGGGGAGADAPEVGWSEHQTGDGRKFYYHEETQTCSWEKPEVLMTPEERANDTKWREYKIWDGRAFYHNKETKVSCWSMPPELRKLRGESSGVDDRPLPLTIAEKRRAFWDLLKEKGVDESWTWSGVDEATREEPRAAALEAGLRKQCFAELLGFSLRQKQIEAREKDRNAASAFERLIEERLGKPSDLSTPYEEAAKLLSGEEAWSLIRSDVRRDEVFQSVMERLEERHKKARLESRSGRVVRLQRLMASDPELRRVRLRWKDAAALLARKDEMQEEQPPLEALRVWASLLDLRQASEHEIDGRSKVPSAEAAVVFREERRRRDAFVAHLKELAIKGSINADSSWANYEAAADGDPKLVALHEGPGATAMELFDEFQEDFRRDGAELFLGVTPGTIAQEAMQEPPPRKRQRTGFSPAVLAKEEEPAVVPNGHPSDGAMLPEDDTNALDALIAGGASVLDKKEEKADEDAQGPKAEKEEEAEVEEEDPLMEVVAKAAARR